MAVVKLFSVREEPVGYMLRNIYRKKSLRNKGFLPRSPSEQAGCHRGFILSY